MTSLLSGRVATHLLWFVLCATGQAWGVTVPVLNAGFENPTLGDGGSTPSAPGWTSIPTGSGGITNPNSVLYPSGTAPEGQNVAYINTPFAQTSRLEQTLSTVVAPGLEYTLEVEAGERLDNFGRGWDGWIELLTAGNMSLAATRCPVPGLGVFLTCTASFTAPMSGGPVGQPLKISLQNRGSSSLIPGQVNFDDVRLTAIPIPAAAYLFGSGLIGLAGIARTRKST